MHKQSGWTVWSVLGVVALALLFILLFMKLFPPYYDNLKLVEAMEDVSKESRAASFTRRKVITELEKKLYIDFAADLFNLNQSLRMVKEKKATVMIVEYEVVVHLAFNISALLDFNNEVSIPLR
ncbi:DUF4845 domain-containing protein [Pseudomonadota bacterium]